MSDESALWKELVGGVYTSSTVRDNLHLLCDRIGGRVSGTPQGRQAEAFALKTMSEIGLENVRREIFRMPIWRRGRSSVEMLLPVRRTLPSVLLGNTPSTPPDGITADAVDVGYGTEGEFRRLKRPIRGKLALCMNGVPSGHRPMHRTEKMTLCHSHGVRGMIFVNNIHGGLPSTGTCSFNKRSSLVGMGISREDGENIRRFLERDERVSLRIRASSRFHHGTAGNIVGELVGGEKRKEVVIVCAHLDAWDLAQGAVDNGSGVATVLEAARAILATGQRPSRTIRFILFMGEEAGLHGSKAYVRRHQRSLANVVAVLNLDCVGTPSGFKLYGNDDGLPFFRNLARRLSPLGFSPENVTSKMSFHSDHQPFMLSGVPSLALHSILLPEQGKYYHSHGDTLDKVDMKQIHECAVGTAIALWELANVRKRPMKAMTEREVRRLLRRENLLEPLKREEGRPFRFPVQGVKR